jgi:two-component system sensor histidine kinase QseC
VELAAISQGLNDLLGRLEASFERERRFSADLAHEIRTPVAELRTLAEVKLRGAAATDREGFQDALDIAQQMEAIVAQMLALARSEQKSAPVQFEPVVVAGLVESLWQSLSPRAMSRRLTARFELPAEDVICTDAKLLRGILLNLPANAVDYTPTGGQIRVALARDHDDFMLFVANTVHDLEASDVPRLFDRFWRKDPARSGGEHTGLGLPLAKSFAELLGLSLKASLTAEGELLLILRGPSQPVVAS